MLPLKFTRPVAAGHHLSVYRALLDARILALLGKAALRRVWYTSMRKVSGIAFEQGNLAGSQELLVLLVVGSR